jgi:aromatic-L-amino-acid decarboxylase
MLREKLTATGWNIVNSTPLPVVCFTRPGLAVSRLVAELREHQIAWMSDAEVGGVPVMRACITSFRTSVKDVAWVVEQMNSMVSSVPKSRTA